MKKFENETNVGQVKATLFFHVEQLEEAVEADYATGEN